MDGTGTPVRPAEVAGRAGKQPHGSAKTRQAQVVTVWTAQSPEEEGKPGRDPGSITYSAGLASAAALDTRLKPIRPPRTGVARSDASRLHRNAPMRGTGRWFCLDLEHCPGTVSSSHPDPRPIPCQGSFAPNRSSAVWRHQPGNQPWATARCTELDAGKLHAIVSALRPPIGSSHEAAKCAIDTLRSRPGTRYPKFHAQGLCTATGVLEAGWQSGDRDPAQAGRHALQRLRCQRQHRSALCQTQWTIRGFLGTSPTASRACRMTLTS
jgi:hypothetical protein